MRLCIQCNQREVQGCRCRIGADYCKECRNAHPGPHKTIEQWRKEYADEAAKQILQDIEQRVLDEFKNSNNRIV